MENSIQLSKRTFKNELQKNSKLSKAKEEHERRSMEKLKRNAQIWEAASLEFFFKGNWHQSKWLH
jgi:hypothetical protein